MSHSFSTVLNDTAFTLIGVLFSFTYLQVNAWWHERRQEPHAKPLTSLGFLSLFLILFAAVSTIYFVRRDLQQQDRDKAELAYRSCQAAILQNNIKVQNDRSERVDEAVDAQVDSINAQINYIAQFQKLVHQGSSAHANAKQILQEFDHDADTTIRTLRTAKQALKATKEQRKHSPLKLISTCQKPDAS